MVDSVTERAFAPAVNANRSRRASANRSCRSRLWRHPATDAAAPRERQAPHAAPHFRALFRGPLRFVGVARHEVFRRSAPAAPTWIQSPYHRSDRRAGACLLGTIRGQFREFGAPGALKAPASKCYLTVTCRAKVVT